MKEIQLTKGYVALVDDHWFESLNKHKWCVRTSPNSVYAVRRLPKAEGGKMIYMHRVVLGVTDPKVRVDHEDGNGLNNQEYNVRPATHKENMWNVSSKGGTSKYRGVHWTGTGWNAQIKANGKVETLGTFRDEHYAAWLWNQRAKDVHGIFFRPNVLPEDFKLPNPDEIYPVPKTIIKSNTSGYRGVRLNPQGRWRAQVMVMGKHIGLGIYDDIHDAARAYNEGAKKYHGIKAVLNIINEEILPKEQEKKAVGSGR